MRHNRGFIHIILVFLIVIPAIFAILFYLFSKSEYKSDDMQTPLAKPNLTNTESIPTVTTSVSDSWNIPELPRGFDWQEKYLIKDAASDYRMFWTSTTDNSYGDIQFSTTLYSTDLNYNNPKEILDSRDFVNKFGKEMESKGWSFDANYGTKRIMGAAADGVFGSIYGTVKTINNQIRSVGYSYNLKPTSWDGPGTDIVCPCTLHLEIFIGDEINLTEI